MRKVKVKNYFEGVVFILGYVLGFLAMVCFLVNIVTCLVLALLSALILTARYELTINPKDKTIHDYLLILGLKTQIETLHYEELHFIFIKSMQYSQRMGTRVNTTVVKGIHHKAYLKADEKKFLLGESKKLDAISNKVNPLAHQLELEVLELE